MRTSFSSDPYMRSILKMNRSSWDSVIA